MLWIFYSACDCAKGSKDGKCDDKGKCTNCNKHVIGKKCDLCANGYINFPKCDKCQDGYYGYPNCQSMWIIFFSLSILTSIKSHFFKQNVTVLTCILRTKYVTSLLGNVYAKIVWKAEAVINQKMDVVFLIPNQQVST